MQIAADDCDVAELPLEQIGSVLRLLFTSHPYYVDRPSRKAVRRCFISFCESPKYSEAFLKRIIPAIKHESQKSGIAASNAFVLLEWAAELFPQLAAAGDAFGALFSDLSIAVGSLLDICLGSTTAKHSLKEQTLRVTRRGLRTTFKAAGFEKTIPLMVEKLTVKASTPTPKNALLLGIISGVCSRLPKPKEVLFGVKKPIYEFYVREILGSRTVIPAHISGALGDFFSAFTTSEDFASEVLPSLEKGLLRSPEIVLNDLLSPLLRSLSLDIDLSVFLFEKLLKQFLSCLKSTNPIIRTGAVAAFQVAISRSTDEASLEKIALEILTPLKSGKIPSADQRVLYARMLDSIPATSALSKLIPEGLAGLVVKEPNEHAITAIISTFSKFLSVALNGDIAIDKTVVEAVNKGLSEKRPLVRRGASAWWPKPRAVPKQPQQTALVPGKTAATC